MKRVNSESNAETFSSFAESCTSKATASTTTTTGTGYDLRHGLTLQETADGLAVIGHPHRTYKARHELKRHGAHWNARARQWEATTPRDCDTLRHWLTHQEPTTATAAPSTTYIYII